MTEANQSDNDPRRRFLIPSGARVVYPLCGDVLDLINGTNTDSKCDAEVLPNVDAGGGASGSGCPDIDVLNKQILLSTILWKSGDAAVLRLSARVALKTASDLDTGHITTLEYIREHAPDLAMPCTLGVLVCGKRTFHFMTHIAGDTLESCWGELSAGQKRSVQKQLDSIFRALRDIPPPPLEDGKRLFGGGVPRRCKDTRRMERVADMPIANETEFNKFLTSRSGRLEGPWIRMVRSSMRNDHACVMTHGDFHPRNIIVNVCNEEDESDLSDGNIKVRAVIDWDKCGWYPEYWEFVKAIHTIAPRSLLNDWWEFLPPSIGVWPAEYSLDMLISRWHG